MNDQITMLCMTCGRTFTAAPGQDFCTASCRRGYYRTFPRDRRGVKAADGWRDTVRAARGIYGQDARLQARDMIVRAPARIADAARAALAMGPVPQGDGLVNKWMDADRELRMTRAT